MKNIPTVTLGIVAVSRDCFPISLSHRRREQVVTAFRKAGGVIFEAQTIVENENDALKALEEIRQAGVNALVVYLGNFGPEGPETLLCQEFGGPTMFVAAAEENIEVLTSDRGDAYCGMLNCSYNVGLRGLKPYIPEYPVGTPAEVSAMIAEFLPVARALLGVRKLKIFSFGPRPYDFLACNAPIAPLFRLGVNIQENSEMDLLDAYKKHDGDPRIDALAREMALELGQHGNRYPAVLPRLAQYELTLLDWAEQQKGAAEYVCFANKCWPAFESCFGFVPCHVNSRLAQRGCPVSCEVDIYGALSEFIGACVTERSVTLLDINNTVPEEMYRKEISGKHPYGPSEVFMGFHCGNTPLDNLESGVMGYQLIMKRSLEPDGEPDITRGTLEGTIKRGPITFYRLQGNAESRLVAYVAQGEVLPVEPRSFGGIGVFAIPQMNRFYRHVLIEKRYPHHGAVAFGLAGKALFETFKILGVEDISFNQPAGMLYRTENPFA